jgi:hypothetical protein
VGFYKKKRKEKKIIIKYYQSRQLVVGLLREMSVGIISLYIYIFFFLKKKNKPEEKKYLSEVKLCMRRGDHHPPLIPLINSDLQLFPSFVFPLFSRLPINTNNKRKRKTKQNTKTDKLQTRTLQIRTF